jgi:hypothetical protein
MKRFQWAIALPLLVVGPYAYADSNPTFNITQETFSFGFEGEGFFTLSGPGTNISGDAAVSCQDWCNGQIFPPGSDMGGALGFDGQLFIEVFTSARIGGHTFDSQYLQFADILAIQVPACGNPISGSAGSDTGPLVFTLRMPPCGSLSENFVFIPELGGYTFHDGSYFAGTPTSAPEPGTLGLLVAGLAGIVGAARRRRGCGR